MRRLPILLLALHASACEDTLKSESDGRIGPPQDPSSVDYMSGTRLRARVYVAGSGARMRHAWFDLQTGQDCRFTQASDGRFRCLPWHVSVVLYADAACSRRATILLGWFEAPQVVAYRPQSGCSSSVHALGQSRPAAEGYVLKESGCVPLASTFGDVLTMHDLGPAIDPSNFVGAEVVRETGGTSLAKQYLQAEDGARQAMNPFDLVRNASCSESTSDFAAGPSDRCIPEASSYHLGLFKDPACTEWASGASLCAPQNGETPFNRIYPEHQCHGVGPVSVAPLVAVAPTPTYELDGEQCVASEPGGAGAFFSSGEPIPVDSLPTTGHAHDPGEEVAVEWLLSTDGQRLRVDDFYDTRADRRCTPARASDCTMRCIPRAPLRRAGWLDDGCTQPVVMSFPDHDCEEQPPALIATNESWTPCKDYVSRVFRTGKSLPAPAAVYESSECWGLAYSLSTTYAEATEVPASEFPELTEAIE